MRTIISAFILITVLTSTGCKDKIALDENGVPGKLVIGVFGGENPGRTQNIMEPIRKYMEQKLGIPVEMHIVNDYTTVIEALHAKKIHMAYLGPFSYVLAAQRKDIEPIAVLGLYGKPFMYHSNIFVRANSGLNSMADVKANAKSLTLCFTDPASTSGHLIPRSYLNSIGLNPDNAFKETMFAGSHAASVLTVAAGKVDIGCVTDEYGIDLMVKRGLVKKGALKVIWVSDPIIGSPVVIRKDINKDLAKKVQQFYLDFAKDQPGIFEKYLKVYYVQPHADLAYIPVPDSAFNGIRKIVNGIKDLKLVK
jgi:phosphonate transport system substrate-binding protein